MFELEIWKRNIYAGKNIEFVKCYYTKIYCKFYWYVRYEYNGWWEKENKIL